MLIRILIIIFPKFLSLCFGQTWSHNLEFFKLTEIWYSSALLHTDYSFNVFFFQSSFHPFFGETFVPISDALQTD